MATVKYLFLIVLSFGLVACHEGVWHLIRAEAPPVTIEPAVLPESVGLDEPEVPPANCDDLIKGNISADGRLLYHAPGMPNYNSVKIDEEAGERFFCSVQEAENAGWVKAGG